MADADLIPLHELSWSAWVSRRHGIYDPVQRSIVYSAAYVLPRTRCRLWARRNGYRISRQQTLFPHRIRATADGPIEYEWIEMDLVRRERGTFGGPH